MTTLAKWTVEDYHRMIDSGVLNNRSVELLEGEIIEMSPEGPLHRFTNDTVAEYLRELLRGQAKVFEAHPITLTNSEPEPDIAVVRLPNSNYLTHHPYPEDIYWLVEIAAESRVERKRADPASAQDARECCPSKGTSAKTANTTIEEHLGRKKRIYAHAGINEYWIINLKTTEIIVFREPSGNDYKTKFTVNKGTINPTAFPNIQIKVKTLLGRT